MADLVSARGGRLIVIRGCMFAGKTGRLIGELRKAQDAGDRVIAFRHARDDRYQTRAARNARCPAQTARESSSSALSAAAVLLTHDRQTFPAIAVPTVAALAAHGAADVDVLAIDEAQFFGRELVGTCRAFAAAGKTVLVAGIHHDAWGQDFPPLPELAGVADEIVTLTAPCARCGRAAQFSQRLTPLPAGAAQPGAGLILIGGIGDYEPRCAACFEPLPGPKPVYS